MLHLQSFTGRCQSHSLVKDVKNVSGSSEDDGSDQCRWPPLMSLEGHA